METTSAFPDASAAASRRSSDLFRQRLECPDLEYSMSRQRAARSVLSFSRTPAWTAHCLAGQTRRLARNRRARQGIAQLPDLDAHLQRHRWGVLPCADRVAFLAMLWVRNAVFVIIASIQASNGKFYRYPMTIRFIE